MCCSVCRSSSHETNPEPKAKRKAFIIYVHHDFYVSLLSLQGFLKIIPLYVKNNVILLVILDWKERADFYFEKLKLLSKRQLNVNFSHWFYRIWPRRARPHVFPAGFKFWPLIFWPLFSFSRTSSWASASFGIASARLRPSWAFASTSASCSFTFLSFFFL